jgi:hypothetical protein
MIGRVLISTVAFGACLAVLHGCASSGRVVKTYEDPNFSGGPFKNVLVVGVHRDGNARRRFESTVASAIREGGTAAAPSLNFMRLADQISRDTLAPIVQREGFDAVLVTRLIDSALRVENRQGRTTVEAQRRDDVFLADFFRYDYVEYQDPMVSTTVRSVVLATDVYAVTNEAKIWSVESTVLDKASVFEAVVDTSRALANALSRDSLIR